MVFDLPIGIRQLILSACYLSPLAQVYAESVSSSEYYDAVRGGFDSNDYWTLDSVDNLDWKLGQKDTNGNSKLGSLDAPTLDSFLPSRKRQTTTPWGTRTAADTNPADAPDTGAVRNYTFTITHATLAPDGVQVPVMLINGQFPGPTIEANWGDTISVMVQNNLGDEGTSMHWHGMLQQNTNFEDGVPGVTQCPIAPGQSYTYTFRASMYGTSWYHSHYSAQYTMGLFGPIVVHGPTDNAPYDIDLGPVLLTDWYYQDYHSIVQDVLGTDFSKVAPISDNNLINGKGIADCSSASLPCTPNAGLAQFQFTQGKIHRLRLINAGSEGVQKFSIDHHVLTVMAVDFIPVVPYKTTVVTLAIGQRVDVLVTADGQATDSTFMRSTIPTSCSRAKQPNGLAVIYYNDADKSIPPSTTAHPDNTVACAEESLDKAIPAYRMTPDSTPDLTLELDISVSRNGSGTFLWEINNSTFRANYDSPTLPLLSSGATPASLPATQNIYDLASASSVRLVINNRSPIVHPMHIHGYDMFVLAAGGSAPGSNGFVDWDGSIARANNPVRRDTYLLQPNGYMVMQINSINPGVWPFHCHIAWHVSGGLYTNLVTQSGKVANTLGTHKAESDGLCKSWSAWTGRSKTVVGQIDSGI